MTVERCETCGNIISGVQFDLLVEVKTAPSSDTISLSERDLAGIEVHSGSSDIGALAVLNDDDAYRCSMIFIESQNIPRTMIGVTRKSDLPEKSELPTLAYISSRWEDWILRTGAIEFVFEDEHSNIPRNIENYLRIHHNSTPLPPVEHTPTRSMMVAARLNELRRENGALFEKASKEGYLHQYILYHIISKGKELACSFSKLNTIGVPDIFARINQLD